MTTPPLLVAAALCFWGWQTGLVLFAWPLAVILEVSRLTRWRWEFSRDDFDRLASATSLMSWGIAGYLFITTDPSRALTTLFQWLPLLLIFLMLAQAYGTAPRIDVTGLFWTIRRRRAQPGHRRLIELSPLYVVVCLLSAAAANARGPWFYAGLCAIGGWALWSVRASRYPAWTWAACLGLAVLAGYGGHVGLYTAQRAIESKALEWITEWLRRDTDPFRSSTAIGSIGSLKLSDRIVLRLEPVEQGAPPALLREATYNIYNAPTWLAYDAGFSPIAPEGNGTIWPLGSGRRSHEIVTLSTYLRRGRGILPLPHGAFELDRLTAAAISRTPMGAVRVDEGLGLSTFRVRFASEIDLDQPPTELDLRVPANEGVALTRVVDELGLARRSPTAIRDAVARHFRERFRYTASLGERPRGATPIADFLERTRAGHCEYFATATVLVLRAAGVPARYAAGYAVQEWSRLENRWVVRTRHAHSWALAYINGAWQDVDTTPATWVEDEQALLASAWQPLTDLLSWAGFLIDRWRWGERGDGLTRYAAWMLVPLVLILAWRLYFRRQRTRLPDVAPAGGRARSWIGADSELYAVEARLDGIGLGRLSHEPVSRWLARIEAGAPPELAIEPIREIARLHYRYRFDPAGLSAAERDRLRASARAWLARHENVARLR